MRLRCAPPCSKSPCAMPARGAAENNSILFAFLSVSSPISPAGRASGTGPYM